MSLLIVSLLLTASLATVSAARAGRQVLAEQAAGRELAQELLSEILRHGYFDASGADGLGPNATEAATGNRSLFNDVDDFNGWSASPPQNADGSRLDDYTGWTRRVVVARVNPADPNVAGTVADRAKLITVTVLRGDRIVAQVSAIRTAAMTNLETEGLLP